MSSQISATIDLSASGKHAGFLKVPHSVHQSAYGWIPLPVTVLNNGTGPTILLLAGNHGDEYEGQIALNKLANDLQPNDIQGQIIILPMLNFPAAQAGTRTSPIDQGNLNRSFPGDPSGTPTQMIAHYIESVLLPDCDYMVDLHSGGSSLFYPPTLLRGLGHSASESAKLLALQQAFDLPYAWVFTSGGGRSSTARTAMGAANRNGVISVMAELGGGGGVTRHILHQTERGLRRILASLDMLPDYHLDAPKGTRELQVQGSIYALENGLFEPYLDIGEPVEKDQPVGEIHFAQTPQRPSHPVLSPFDGMVLCKRAMGQVQTGDAVFQIAKDLET